MTTGKTTEEGVKKTVTEKFPKGKLNSLSLLLCQQCNNCVGVQQLSWAVLSYRHHAFNVHMYACVNPPITSVKYPVTSHKKLFLPPLYLHWHYADGAPPSLTHQSLLSQPLIHLPPLCSRSLPPTTHHLLHPIITRSTSLLQLPWQQLCWAQVPMSPVVCH